MKKLHLSKSSLYLFFLFILFSSSNLLAEIKFCAVGDILLDRGVRKSIIKNGDEYTYENIVSYIQNSDYAMCNFEAPVCKENIGDRIRKKFSFRVEPEYLTNLRKCGFNLANLANNHSIDMGKDGLVSSITNLQNSGIIPFGAGINQDSAFVPVIIEKDNIKIAIFGYLEFLLEGIVFDKNSPFPAYGDFEKFCVQISKYRNLVDHIIVTFHWGKEDSKISNSRQSELAHKVIDAGADLVLGHHPHVLQEIEKYKHRLIIYSLGNFIFDNNSGPRSKSVIFTCTFYKFEIKDFKLFPIQTHENRPIIADEKVSKEIYRNFKNISDMKNIKLNYKNKLIELKGIKNKNKIIKEFKINESNIIIKSNEILISQNGIQKSKFKIIESDMLIHDACYVCEHDTMYIYSINGSKNQKYAKRICIFPIDLKNSIFLKPTYDSHIYNNPWKIISKDIDGDNNPEIIVGCWKSTRYYKLKENRILILNRENNRLYTKWFGSKIGDIFLDFIGVSNLNNQNILFLQKSKKYFSVNSYKWSGFGLEKVETLGKFNNIELGRQYLYKLVN